MTDETDITFITTLTAPSRGIYSRRASRCVGYLRDTAEAIAAVKANAGDIHEDGVYPLCVLETIGEGIYPAPLSRVWFEWDAQHGGYREISGPPEDLARITGFSLG